MLAQPVDIKKFLDYVHSRGSVGDLEFLVVGPFIHSRIVPLGSSDPEEGTAPRFEGPRGQR